MSQQELLTSVATALDRHGIPCMVTGSIASSLYGEPRLTHDIDVVVQLVAEDAPKLADSCGLGVTAIWERLRAEPAT